MLVGIWYVKNRNLLIYYLCGLKTRFHATGIVGCSLRSNMKCSTFLPIAHDVEGLLKI